MCCLMFNRGVLEIPSNPCSGSKYNRLGDRIKITARGGNENWLVSSLDLFAEIWNKKTRQTRLFSLEVW